MELRDAQREDFSSCIGLLKQLLPEQSFDQQDSREIKSLFERLVSASDSKIIVAEAGGKVVALLDVTFRQTFFHRGLTMIIEELIVDEAHRREGLGTRLVRRAEQIACERGCSAIELSSDLLRDETHEFWHVLGYNRLAWQFRKSLPKSAGCNERSEKQIQPLYFVFPGQAPRMTQFPGLETTILTGLSGEKMMMVLNATLPGHTVPTHTHPHEQIGMVYAGKAHLRIGDEERIVSRGDFYCIPGNTPHSDTCMGDEPFVMLDIFYPIREEFIAKLNRTSQDEEQPATALPQG